MKPKYAFFSVTQIKPGHESFSIFRHKHQKLESSFELEEPNNGSLFNISDYVALVQIIFLIHEPKFLPIFKSVRSILKKNIFLTLAFQQRKCSYIL